MNSASRYSILALLLASALVGTYAYIWLVQPFSSLNNEHAYLTIQKLTKNAGQLMYGTITSIDNAAGMVAFATESPYDGSATTLQVHLLQPSVIAYQTLGRSQNGAYDSLTTQTAAALSDIPVGSRAAIIVLRDEKDQLSTNYILFGNPL